MKFQRFIILSHRIITINKFSNARVCVFAFVRRLADGNEQYFLLLAYSSISFHVQSDFTVRRCEWALFFVTTVENTNDTNQYVYRLKMQSETLLRSSELAKTDTEHVFYSIRFR